MLDFRLPVSPVVCFGGRLSFAYELSLSVFGKALTRGDVLPLPGAAPAEPFLAGLDAREPGADREALLSMLTSAMLLPDELGRELGPVVCEG